MTWTSLTAAEKVAATQPLIEERGLSYGQAALELGTTRVAIAGVVYRGKLKSSNPPGGGSGLAKAKAREARPRRNGGETTNLQRRASIARKAKESAMPRPTITDAFEQEDPPRDVRPVYERAWDALPGAVPKTLANHRSGECLWGVGDHHPALFCCLPVKEGSHYCLVHYAMGRRVVPQTPAKPRSRQEKLRA